MASVSISLDDEVQYRCAGYIQAEIERYAELLDVGDAEDEDVMLDSDGEPLSDGEQGDAPARAGKGKRTFKEGQLFFLMFVAFISTFLQLIPIPEFSSNKSISLLMLYQRSCEQSVLELFTSDTVQYCLPITVNWALPSIYVPRLLSTFFVKRGWRTTVERLLLM